MTFKSKYYQTERYPYPYVDANGAAVAATDGHSIAVAKATTFEAMLERIGASIAPGPLIPSPASVFRTLQPAREAMSRDPIRVALDTQPTPELKLYADDTNAGRRAALDRDVAIATNKLAGAVEELRKADLERDNAKYDLEHLPHANKEELAVKKARLAKAKRIRSGWNAKLPELRESVRDAKQARREFVGTPYVILAHDAAIDLNLIRKALRAFGAREGFLYGNHSRGPCVLATDKGMAVIMPVRLD